MTVAINTYVAPDPASCRAAVAELNKLRAGTEEATTAMRRVSIEAESCWVGQAGESFRRLMHTNARESGELEESMSRTAVALTKYADQIETVLASMQRARELAAGEELFLTPTQILPPGNPPTPPPPGSVELGPYTKAKAEYDAKARVFEESASTVEAARTRQQDAYNDLIGALNYEKSLPERMTTGTFATIGLSHALVTAPQSAADRLASRANAAQIRAASAKAVLEDPDVAPSERAAAVKTMNAQKQLAAQADTAALSNQRLATKLHRRLKISPNGQRLAGATWISNPRILNKVSKFGTVTTIAGGYLAWKVGKPADEALVSGVGSLIGGAVGAEAAVVLLPVSLSGGPVTLLAAGVGGAVFGVVGGWLAEESYEDAKEAWLAHGN